MNYKRNILIFLVLITLLLSNFIIEKNHIKVDYSKYTEEDYMNEIIYSCKNYCYLSENFGGVLIDFSNYNNELNLRFNIPVSGKIKIDESCNIDIKQEVIINNKKCIYQDSKSFCK